MSDDLIKRADAIGAITNHCENECYYRVDNWCPQCQREEFQEAIKAIPSADRPQLAKDIVEPISNGNVIMSEDTYEDLLDRPQGRYIDADALVTVCLYDNEHEERYTERMSIGECLDLLTEEGCPKTADRPQGKWIRTGRTNIYGGVEVQCTNCGDKVMVQHLEDEWFCRHCGADMGMKGEDDEA